MASATEVRPHLKLGITRQIAARFLQEDLHIIRDDASSRSDGLHGTDYEELEVVRRRLGEAWEPWIGQTYGYFPLLTGYDLNCAIRKFLRDNRAEDKSVCEVLLSRGGEWAEGVGEAQAFLSHVQSEPPQHTMRGINMINNGSIHYPAKYVWVDYFSLRQCQNDFEAEEVVALVGQIGHTAILLDKYQGYTYTARSFCVLESYAAIKAGGRVSVLHEWVRWPPPCGRRFLRVDSAVAQTRRPEDKAMIDAWIERDVGHAKLDAALEREIAVNIQQQSCLNVGILGCFPCCSFCIWIMLVKKRCPYFAMATQRACGQLFCCSWPSACGCAPPPASASRAVDKDGAGPAPHPTSAAATELALKQYLEGGGR